jgi:hypothetical protein
MRRIILLWPLLALPAAAFAACGNGARPSHALATYPTAAPAATAADASSGAIAADAGAAVETKDADVEATVAVEPPPDAPPASTSACNEQPPQDFLIRKNFFPKWNAKPDEAKERQAAHQRAIAYRTEQYGYVGGFGSPSMNPHPPPFYTKKTEWFGLPVVVHEKIIPALQCVEQEIKDSCADHPYTPRALAGIRFHNTYSTGEITNHMYGIAMDIDPAINSCCGCVPPWNSNPLCHKQVTSEYERMAMPECWVHAFEKYGFYWLGHDVLQDTMHFEFLGDPDRILKSPPPR